jgi:hypothetical protein
VASPYTADGSGALEGSYLLPDDGDAATAASVDVPFETVIRDLARSLINRKIVQVATSQILTDGTPAPAAGSTSLWTFNDGLWTVQTTQANNTGRVNNLMFPMRLPDGCQLTSVTARITPAGGHGALPANMPLLEIMKYDKAAGTFSTPANNVDGASPVASYNVQHTFSVAVGNMPGGVAMTIDRANYTYWARFVCEFGANNLGPFTLNHIEAFFSTAAIDARQG